MDFIYLFNFILQLTYNILENPTEYFFQNCAGQYQRCGITVATIASAGSIAVPSNIASTSFSPS